MSQRKWALNVVNSNSPDITRQQQWILDNFHKAEEERIPFPPDRNRRAAGAHSSSPQQLGDGERVSDGSLENYFEGFGSPTSEGEGGASDGLAESEEEDEDDSDDDDDDEVHEEVGSKPQQSRLPSRLNSSLIHPLHSKFLVSRRGPRLHHRHPPNNLPPVRPPEDNDEEEEDPHGHVRAWNEEPDWEMGR